MSMLDTELPRGWVEGTLADFVQPRGEKALPSDMPEATFLGMDHIEAHTTRILGGVPASKMKSAAARFYKGDVLYGRLRPYLNKVATPSFDGLASAEFIVFPDSKVLRSHFLKLRLAAFDFVHFASHLNEGDRPRVGFDQIGSFPVQLPPEPEQRRIVAKIEELFSELDNGVENLITAREQLKAYRYALLKSAFSGELSKRWREKASRTAHSKKSFAEQIEMARWQAYLRAAQGGEARKTKSPSPLMLDAPVPADIALPGLPEGWHWAPLQWLLSVTKKSMTTGPFGTMLKKHEHRSNGVPVLGIENIGRATFLPGNKIFIDEEKAKDLEAFEVLPGDILISRSGTVGEICMVPDGVGKALISTNLMRISLNTDVILPEFFVLMFQGGGSVKEQVKALCKGSSREFLNQGILRSMAYPLCGLDEQRVVVSEIKNGLSKADALESEIDHDLNRAASLRQAILKQAFSGQMVAQDSADEPASVLLERIRAEQEGGPACGRHNKKKEAA